MKIQNKFKCLKIMATMAITVVSFFFLATAIIPKSSLAHETENFNILRASGPADYYGFINLDIQNTIQQLDTRELHEGKYYGKIWSSTPAWRTDAGIIAGRKHDDNFGILSDWRSRLEYIKRDYSLKQLVEGFFPFGRGSFINALSPAEKYDLLAEDLDATFTQSLWAEVASYGNAGKLEHWFGICEGEAAASIMYPEPIHNVTLHSALSNTEIVFYPDDIKGLASFAWSAYVANGTPIIGSRCSKALKPGIGFGTHTPPECFDINPGTWHVLALNLIGRQLAPLMINRDVAAQVWNFLVRTYKYNYFNVMTNSPTDSYDEAKVPISSFTSDPYRAVRSNQSEYIVGVNMDIELRPGEIRNLKYDIEIDQQGRILGGEWYMDNHPDFAWTIDSQYWPKAQGDFALGTDVTWDGSKIPNAWRNAIINSSRAKQPLIKIVDELVKLSSE